MVTKFVSFTHPSVTPGQTPKPVVVPHAFTGEKNFQPKDLYWGILEAQRKYLDKDELDEEEDGMETDDPVKKRKRKDTKKKKEKLTKRQKTARKEEEEKLSLIPQAPLYVYHNPPVLMNQE